ncbi:MAG: tRNA pseudouridine(38-40) synthase TruA [Chromatiales bacterium]|nr:MAG: tRNA pseudouridine(38-40) synthase TruA [Chromatiales bacterium]
MSPETVGSGPQRHRVAVGLEYDGTGYSGWQIQHHAPSVQATLAAAVSRVAAEPVDCVGAGRTDAGVHAEAQVAHFDTQAGRKPREWVLGINSNLPDDINVLWAADVPGDFHARYSATERGYRYRILNRPVRSALQRHRAWWVRQPLDDRAMAEAAERFVGEHDFSAFRAAACQARSPMREVRQAVVSRAGDIVTLHFVANAFLHHMVRNMVGTLVRVGLGEAANHWIGELLAGRDRKLAGMTAPAVGLTLVSVCYPPAFGLPDSATG